MPDADDSWHASLPGDDRGVRQDPPDLGDDGDDDAEQRRPAWVGGPAHEDLPGTHLAEVVGSVHDPHPACCRPGAGTDSGNDIGNGTGIGTRPDRLVGPEDAGIDACRHRPDLQQPWLIAFDSPFDVDVVGCLGSQFPAQPDDGLELGRRAGAGSGVPRRDTAA